MTKLIAWFEIPATDLGRAQTFYQSILGVQMQNLNMGGANLAVFPYERETATGGCLLTAPEMKPSADGAVLYLNAGESLDAVLERVPGAGGSVALGRTELPKDMGCFAHIIDPEGNRVGLHAMK